VAAEEAAQLYQAFVDQDPAAAIQVVERVRSSGVAQAQLFDALYVPAMSALGGAWASGEIDEMTFTQAAVVAEQIGSFVLPPAAKRDTGVTLVIGSMHRDLHSITKDVIASALKESGYRVNDLGVDVRPTDFLERLEETGARIVIVCAEMLSTARAVSRVRQMFESAGKDDIVILAAGAPFAADAGLAREAGANGVITGAESALKIVGRVAADLADGRA